MIPCEIYEESSNSDKEPRRIGKPFSLYYFNTLPQKGDCLWLHLDRECMREAGFHPQIACVVKYSTQWVGTLPESNKGYIEVELSEEDKGKLKEL